MPRFNPNHYVGKRLRVRRTLLGLSQERVGQAVGVASQQVQKYEKGVNVMSVNRLLQFAHILRVPVAYFFEGLKSPPLKRKKRSPHKLASEREVLEIIKSFNRIHDRRLRKRLADLARHLATPARR